MICILPAESQKGSQLNWESYRGKSIEELDSLLNRDKLVFKGLSDRVTRTQSIGLAGAGIFFLFGLVPIIIVTTSAFLKHMPLTSMRSFEILKGVSGIAVFLGGAATVYYFVTMKHKINDADIQVLSKMFIQEKKSLAEHKSE